MFKFGGEDCLTAEDLPPQNSDKSAKSVNESSNKAWEDVTLYHGSRGGIDGEIQPISRDRCDFGRGFYMGENPEQVKSLVVDDAAPVFYKLTFKLSEIPDNKILVLDGEDWTNAVLASRKHCPEFSQLKLAKHWLRELDKYDVIIGEIADDRMRIAMKRFTENGLTDKGLLACLQFANYGKQYVAKTEFACSKIKIESSRAIEGEEADIARDYYDAKMDECKNIVNTIAIKHLRDGLYLEEIIEREKAREKRKGYDI